MNFLTFNGYSEITWYWISISNLVGLQYRCYKAISTFFAATSSPLLSFSSGAFNGLDKIVSRRKNEKYLGEFSFSHFFGGFWSPLSYNLSRRVVSSLGLVSQRHNFKSKLLWLFVQYSGVKKAHSWLRDPVSVLRLNETYVHCTSRKNGENLINYSPRHQNLKLISRVRYAEQPVRGTARRRTVRRQRGQLVRRTGRSG